MNAQDAAAIAARIEAIVRVMSGAEGSPTAAHAQELVQLVMAFHRAGLARVIEIARAERVLERFSADPLVASLFDLHEFNLPPDAGPPLIQLTRPAAAVTAAPESCGVCRAPLPAAHEHVADVETGRLLCVCAACTLRDGPYRAMPARAPLPSMTISAAQWDALGIPVGLAFFFYNSRLARTVACYPGPAGATESLLPLEAWPQLVDANPWIEALAPDVEALLVRRVDEDYRCFIVPIATCYELVGRIRQAWTGFAGGTVEAEIDRFFSGLAHKSLGALSATSQAHSEERV